MAKAHLLIFDDCLGKWGPMKDIRAVFELLEPLPADRGMPLAQVLHDLAPKDVR